jgi:glycosyltransferase involved in cell wall biosynthesis
MPRKICHIIPTLVQGGAEKQMSLLVRHLNRKDFEPHVVVLTHSGPIEDELRAAGVPLHFINKRGKFDPLAYRRLVRLLCQLRPDIVHTWLFAANSYGRLAAWRCGVPVILAAERCVDPWKGWWQHQIDRRLCKITDRMLTNSNGVVEFYRNHGIPAEKFVVIPNAISAADESPVGWPPNPEKGQSTDSSTDDRLENSPTSNNSSPPEVDPRKRMSKDEFFKRLSLRPRKRVVGAVGRLWAQKGYEDLIWAAEMLRVAYEDVWFVIIGDGPDRKKLQAFRDKVEAYNAVRFLGHRNDAHELMSAFDVLWNGSLYEGQSNTILEAMAMGIPVLATDIPGNRDLVVNDQTGYLYPLGNVEMLIRRTNSLLSDDRKRSELGSNAMQRVQHEFSLEKMIASYSQLYRKLVAS